MLEVCSYHRRMLDDSQRDRPPNLTAMSLCDHSPLILITKFKILLLPDRSAYVLEVTYLCYLLWKSLIFRMMDNQTVKVSFVLS